MQNDNSYFDLQVNGYGGVDFNMPGLTGEQLNHACDRLRADGTGGILATITTEHIDEMVELIEQMVRLRSQDELVKEMVVGMHIEGPWLNEKTGYRGAHPLDAIHPANRDDMQRLLDAGEGLVKLVTLAPERDPGFEVTKSLARQGVVVSAGHCNPTMDELLGAVDAGLSMFTHVGNAVPMEIHRHDNIIQRVLSLADRIWLCFIADGVHVHPVALGNYLKLAGLNRCVVVTDAIAPAGQGPGRYTLGKRWDLVIGDDLVARAPDGSHLVGSAISMPKSVDNLKRLIGLNDAEVLQLTAMNPRRAMSMV